MIKVFICTFSFFLSFGLLSQRYAFIEYSTSQGLPQSQVNSIVQDRDGYLWIGTLGGVAKFDGKKFQSFGNNDGLLNNRITHLDIVDNQLFVGHDKGVSFQCASDSFCSTTFPDESISKDVTDFFIYENKIYVSTNGSGLFLFDKKDKKLIHVKDSPARIRSLENYGSYLYLATRNGIYRYKKDFELLEKIPGDSYSSLTRKSDELIFTSYEGILMTFSLNSQTLKEVYRDEGNPFRKVSLDDQGNYWLNSKNGVVLIKESEVIKFTEQTGLPINDINAVFEDREKNKWFGSGGKGLLKFTGEVFTHFNEKNNLPSDLVISLLEDKNGKRWLSTYDKGICTMNTDESVTIETYVPSIVWSMAQLDDRLLFGSNFGLHIYDYENWYSFYEGDGLPSNRIRGLKRRENGDVVIGTSSGTVIFDQNLNGIRSLNSEIDRLNNVRDIAEVGDTLFLASQDVLYQYFNDELKLVRQFDAGINCIEKDNQNSVWVGTENGLYIETEGKLYNYILEENGGANYINFLEKVDTVMFIGTNNGLYEIDLDSKNISHYDINSGLVDLETNLNSSYLDDNNYLWFGTAEGLMRLDLDLRSKLSNTISPKIHLNDIKIDFTNLENSEVQKIINENHDLKIEYKNNNISFDFDGIYLSDPNGLSYSYFLMGFSDSWSPPFNIPSVSFTNLPPGEYILNFKASTIQGLESDVFKLDFEILPPFYRTWWFYVICFLLLTLLIVFLDRLRVKRLDRKNYQLQLEFQNKLTRLEQQSLNASMNRHFIFNSLNSIQYYINSSDKKLANKYLSRFAKLIRKNLDSSNQENGMVALSDELERLELYLELESMRFNEKFDYEIKVDEHVETEMLKVPAMFLQPFVENSIIHGILPLKDRKGMIKILITDHMDHIRIEIKDNGVGIEKSVENKKGMIRGHESQGMLITKGRIELLQKISARSIEMIGPVQISKSDSSINGTLVTFKIIKQYLE